MLCFKDLKACSLEAEPVRGYAVHVVGSFGRNVKALMKLRDVSQETLQTALDVKQGTLSDWLRDRRGLPEGPTLLKFAKVLKVRVEDLIVGVDPEYDQICQSLSAGTARPHAGTERAVPTDYAGASISTSKDLLGPHHAVLVTVGNLLTRYLDSRMQPSRKETAPARAGKTGRSRNRRNAD